MESKVEPWPSLKDYWEAFFTLQTSRQQGMSVGYIPLTEIEAYCSLRGVTEPDEKEQYLIYVRALDQVYLEHVNKKDKGKSDSQEVKKRG